MELLVEEPSIPRRNISCSLQGILSERPSLSSSEYCVCVAHPCHRHQNTLCFSPLILPFQSDNKGHHNRRAPPYYEPWSVQFQLTSIPLSLTCLPRFALLPAAAQRVNKRRVAANGQMWRDHNVNRGEIKPFGRGACRQAPNGRRCGPLQRRLGGEHRFAPFKPPDNARCPAAPEARLCSRSVAAFDHPFSEPRHFGVETCGGRRCRQPATGAEGR